MRIAPRNPRKIRVAALVGIGVLAAGFALTALQANASEEIAGETYRNRQGRNGPPPAGGGPAPEAPPAGGGPAPEAPPEPPAEGGQVSGSAGVSAPEGTVLEASYQVSEGVQIYQCVSGAFVFQAPRALLADGGGQTIQHGAGPSWQSDTDGSRVTATLVTSSPRDNAIPELLLQVADRTGGADSELGGIDFIQRLNTGGGQAPAGPCEDGATADVPYSATYNFLRIA